jgi:predicted CxxxxCH...CXXCH cytochrome family protein
MKTTKNVEFSGRLARVSRILILTMVFCTFLHQGWYSPKAAHAVTIGATTTMVRPAGGTGTNGPLTIDNTNWSCGAGSNRLLVIVVTGEGDTGYLNNFEVTATKGPEIYFIEAARTTASRTAAYIGYLTEPQIIASGTSSIVITAPGVATGFDASVACYSNVNGDNPLVATSVVEGETTAVVTGSFSVSAVNQGMVVLAFADAIAQEISSSTWTGYTDASNAGTGYQTHALYKAIVSNGTETGTFRRAGSARYGIATASLRPLADFKVADGTNPANRAVGQSTTDNSLDGFTLQMNTGTGTVTSLIVTGSANFTSTNIPTNSVKVWRDLGTVGVWDGSDVQISTASTAIAANTTTVTISSEPVTSAAQNYLVTVDIAADAALSQFFTGSITSAAGAGLGTTLSYNDTSATLTISTPNLGVGNGTNPINKIARPSSTNNALDGFTLGTTATSPNSAVTSLIVTGSANFTSGNIPDNGVKVWRDTGTTDGYWDAGDTLISGASSAIANNVTTVTILSEEVTAPAKNYLVTVDISAGATLSQSFTAMVTGAAGSNLGAPTYSDSSSAALTVDKLPSASTSCGSCHAYPPYDGTMRDPVSGAVVGDHQVGAHQVVCATCHVIPATDTNADFAHRNGNIQMQATISGGTYTRGASFPQTNTLSTTGCSNISCHGANDPTPQWGVETVDCTDCHAGTITRTRAAGTLDNVIAEFGQKWGHKKSGRGAVTATDCIVCHLEGNYATQKTSAYHADGNIDLRDPDGAGETAVTDITGGTFTFQKFAISYAAGSRTPTGHTSNTIDNVLTQKFCLACHDNNGATNPTARTTKGSPNQYMPFGGVNLGVHYTTANGAASAGGLIDVKTELATANASAHPVLGPRNRAYPTTAFFNAPYNNFTRTAGTKSNGVVLSCFDCHNTSTLLITRSVSAHGNAVTLRGNIWANPASLCTSCHIPNPGGSTLGMHSAGSALNSVTNPGMQSYINTQCHYCHSSSTNLPVRPVRAQDVHGFDLFASTAGSDTMWPKGAIDTYKPYAFFRNTYNWGGTTSWKPLSGTSVPAGTATCGGAALNSLNCTGNNMTTYAPGGAY